MPRLFYSCFFHSSFPLCNLFPICKLLLRSRHSHSFSLESFNRHSSVSENSHITRSNRYCIFFIRSEFCSSSIFKFHHIPAHFSDAGHFLYNFSPFYDQCFFVIHSLYIYCKYPGQNRKSNQSCKYSDYYSHASRRIIVSIIKSDM